MGTTHGFATYLVAIALTNIDWEFAHVPLYTLWETGCRGEIILAVFHCTGGDILIASMGAGVNDRALGPIDDVLTGPAY